MKRVAVVTGACGYVASHLVRSLVASGWQVYGVDRLAVSDPHWEGVEPSRRFAFTGTNGDDLQEFIIHASPSAVFHLAAAFLRSDSAEAVRNVVASNLSFSAEVLDACRRVPGCVFLNTGSHWQHYQGKDYSPVDVYAATKQAFRTMVDSYAELYGLRATTLTLFDPYGEDDRRRKLLPSIVSAFRRHVAIEATAGEQEVDFVHVSDVVAAYERAFELLSSSRPALPEYGVSSGRPLVLRRLVEDVFGAAPFIPVRWGARPYRPREVMKTCRDLRPVPGWHPEHDVRADLASMCGLDQSAEGV